MRTGIFEPIATVATVVTGVSSIPQAIFPIVLAVAGAMRTRSTLSGVLPASLMCSSFPVSSVTTLLPVAHSKSSIPTIFSVAGVTTAYTSAPCRINSLAMSGVL